MKIRIWLLGISRFGKVCLIMSILLLLLSNAWGDDRRTDKSSLVIMTLNAEFLWDGVVPEEGRVDFPWKNSQTEAEEHMENVAEVIIHSNPDIVNLVEVENLQALETLNNKYLIGRGYLPYFVKGKDTYTGQDVVLLTRIDPENEVIERDDRKGRSGNVKKSVSKNYFAKIQIGNNKIALIGLHFLARPNSEDRRQPREAQADAIASMALELRQQGYLPIVMGDFNDYDGDDGNRDHINNMPITNVLQKIKLMDANNTLDGLVNVASFVPKASRYTAFWDRNRNDRVDYPKELASIDHILLSPELKSFVELVVIPHEHNPIEVTDHFPVVTHLRFSEGFADTSELGIRITSLLPNPPGDENQAEEVTIKNFGSQSIDLTGWILKDLSGRIWTL